ncbi:MAG TPA: DUF2911 domain-containing protein [Longimicrobium sp.]|nr:DUF2911 domain-containing protein [Longimicrobium sp.]
MLRSRRLPITALVAAALTAAAAAPAPAQHGQPARPGQQQQRVLSPRDTARVQLEGGHRVWIDYGRPSMRGRKIMGDLVPYGRVWRTGANAATTFVTDTDLVIGTARVPRGTYTLYTVPTARGWTLIVNKQTGQWGTQYEQARDLVRIPMQVTRTTRPVEQFTIALERGERGAHTLALSWENTRATVPFRAAPAAAARR